ncbi:hypothetical protein EG834_09960 [bacterium]|nr:hypothetical protein [bacterium]
MSLTSFLEFWQSPPSHVAADPVQRVYHAYLSGMDDLDALKSEARNFIIPSKDAKGRLMPIFDPDKVDAVSDLSDQIEQQKDKIKGIVADIAAIEALAGSPTMIELQQKHEQAIHSVKLAETAAGAAMRRAINGRGRVAAPPRPEEIATRPELVEIYAKSDILRAELTPKIDEMFGRLEKIRQITEKYQR